MSKLRIALANVRVPASEAESVSLAQATIAEASAAGAGIVCFPECFVPGYRVFGREVAAPSAEFLRDAWSAIAASAARARIGVVLGTERIVEGGVRIAAMVVDADGSIVGFQDKVQLDPSEDSIYVPGTERRVFEISGLRFGISICHEGWRYPETVRWAARAGAQLVFHPHFEPGGPGAYRPTTFAESANTFHEKALLCRAAENGCYIASVNYASEGSSTTSAVVRPDGTLQCFQPYGVAGLLLADVTPQDATGFLAARYRPIDHVSG